MIPRFTRWVGVARKDSMINLDCLGFLHLRQMSTSISTPTSKNFRCTKAKLSHESETQESFAFVHCTSEIPLIDKAHCLTGCLYAALTVTFKTLWDRRGI
jgi:hypothetical protein